MDCKTGVRVSAGPRRCSQMIAGLGSKPSAQVKWDRRRFIFRREYRLFRRQSILFPRRQCYEGVESRCSNPLHLTMLSQLSWLEQLTLNQRAQGSSPCGSTQKDCFTLISPSGQSTREYVRNEGLGWILHTDKACLS